MQLWIEISVVKFHKVIEMMPRLDACCNERKKGPRNIRACDCIWARQTSLLAVSKKD